MRRAIAECISPSASVQVFRKALYENQDVYVISRASLPMFDSAELAVTPLGGITGVTAPTESIQINGWALDPSEESDLQSVKVYLNDRLIGRGTLFPGKPDILKHFPGTN